ncbi:hypothetical protein G4B88_008242 [Cannabis sativa]|uniref:Disease resistance N-terminal domain-containing protein n=1 Tax=Cannabis sativa TaxID=3483 RepID=A0A7J6FLL4_CANSA|nr:hypothetical protein G4B88_008242 [Cannabis sativa]
MLWNCHELQALSEEFAIICFRLLLFTFSESLAVQLSLLLMALEIVIGAFLSASFDFLLEKIASPYVEKFLFKGENQSSVRERLFKLKSTFNTLAAVRFEVENKRIENPAVEKWLDDLLDAVDDAEDFFGDIEYNAMKPNNSDESRKARGKASKLFCCFSNPSNLTDRVRNANMEDILMRLEYLANQIGNLNFEKNVVKVKPSRLSCFKTSLPDEPEIYVHNEDIVKFEKKTRHIGFVIEHSTNNKPRNPCSTLSPHYHYPPLQSLNLRNCGSSFVSFPNGGLIAPKLSELEISYCHKLKWLPQKMSSLSALKYLEIKGCPLIKSFLEGEGGLPNYECNGLN